MFGNEVIVYVLVIWLCVCIYGRVFVYIIFCGRVVIFDGSVGIMCSFFVVEVVCY